MNPKYFFIAFYLTALQLTAINAQIIEHNKDGVSQYEIGLNYLHGKGVAKDPEKSFDAFHKAAELGHSEAAGAVGSLYAAGLGVDQDDFKAVEWLQKSVSTGSNLAKLNLGRLYLEKRGGLDAPLRGLDLMEEAAAQNLPQAHAQLAELYFFGLESADIKVDYEKAYPHALAAFQGGISSTLNMLGFMKENGYGTKPDLVEAQKYYRQSAFKGDFKAQSNLGTLLDPQSKNRKRRIESIAWLIVAASQNEPLASRKIAEIERSILQKEWEAARAKADELLTQIKP